MALSIDIISDVVCPWCYIGKRRIEAALALYRERFPDNPEPLVRWWPFQLNPDMPAEGVDRGEYLAKKFGSNQVGSIYSRVSAVGSEVGIPFAFDKMVRQPNTLAAHSLIALAVEHGVQHDLAETLFNAYFIEGQNFTDEATLLRLAAEAGIPGDAASECLASEVAREQVMGHEDQARKLGVNGVPFFLFNGAVGVSGAQEAETLLEAMIKAESETETENAKSAETAT
jgi:predicted DsbA family dithiol-disulfide isomerase